MGELKSDILAGMSQRHTRSCSSTALSLSLLFDFILVKLEKLTSHKYVVENGSNVATVLLVRKGYSLAATNQRVSKGRSAKFSLNP